MAHCRLPAVANTMTTRVSWSLQSLTTGAVAAVSDFNEVTEFDYLMLQSVGVVPGNEYQLVVCGYGDRSAAFYATADDSNVLMHTSCNGVPVMSATKSMRNVSYPE
jgi:hypothetical protein